MTLLESSTLSSQPEVSCASFVASKMDLRCTLRACYQMQTQVECMDAMSGPLLGAFGPVHLLMLIVQ